VETEMSKDARERKALIIGAGSVSEETAAGKLVNRSAFSDQSSECRSTLRSMNALACSRQLKVFLVRSHYHKTTCQSDRHSAV
jgi:hypothetical protein